MGIGYTYPRSKNEIRNRFNGIRTYPRSKTSFTTPAFNWVDRVRSAMHSRVPTPGRTWTISAATVPRERRVGAGGEAGGGGWGGGWGSG